ncbi:protein TUNICAMYCIN INDUCED 1-like [Curcuma longa]|uniref:protein TUNICAMYCIN INDUCED 1-like n=1 Tax=Curcuma longa TaxID=136217 RepID=UPI003D9E1A28
MADRSVLLLGFLVLLESGASSDALISSRASPGRAISDLRDSIVGALGLQVEGVEISGFDARDAQVGHSLAYEFDIEIDKKVIPIKLLEDVSRWEAADLPTFGEGAEKEGDGAELVKIKWGSNSRAPPTLPPFQLAGPLELWIQDADSMRISLPHEVEAGTLRKVILADGVAVTLKGARSVSLRLPLQLPLPLNRTHPNSRRPASGLLAIAEAARHAARSSGEPLLSLRIVGPTSLTCSPLASPHDKLKLKRLAPGLVELSSRSPPSTTDGAQNPTLWPLTSLNGSNSNVQGFEELLASLLGRKGEEEGSFTLLKAEVAARSYMKIGFKIEKQIAEGEVDWSSYPEWRTKPEKSMAHFEVLSRIEESGKIIPERITAVNPAEILDSVVQSEQTGNFSMSRASIVHPPQSFFTL